jgi:hypothetical protein
MKTVYFWYNTHFVSNYTFYGALGSIPIFLLWVYLSWIIVLFGAEVAFAAQHVNTYKREIEETRLSAADRDRPRARRLRRGRAGLRPRRPLPGGRGHREHPQLAGPPRERDPLRADLAGILRLVDVRIARIRAISRRAIRRS